MDRFIHPIGVILPGAALGAVGLPILTMVYEMVAWTVFVPNVDAQALLFLLFLNVPGGALLGGITGFIIACLWEGRPAAAGRTALFGGAISALLFICLGWFEFEITAKPTYMERLISVVFWFGLPLLLSGALIGTGHRILAHLCVTHEFPRDSKPAPREV
jgi:hypothetical protein